MVRLPNWTPDSYHFHHTTQQKCLTTNPSGISHIAPIPVQQRSLIDTTAGKSQAHRSSLLLDAALYYSPNRQTRCGFRLGNIRSLLSTTGLALGSAVFFVTNRICCQASSFVLLWQQQDGSGVSLHGKE